MYFLHSSMLFLFSPIADGLSMGLADYISSKAETDYSLAEKRRETWSE